MIEWRVGWIFDIAAEWFWVGFVLRMSRGKPWWVRMLWALSPIIFLAALIGGIWLMGAVH